MKKENLHDLSMFTLRLIVGVIFAIHGAQKLFGMFNGIGLEGTAKLVEGLGLAKPYLVAAIWAYIEFVGGIFLILGIVARWAAAGIAFTVLVYLYKSSLVFGSFAQSAGIEYNVLVIGACIPLILMGGGSWAVWDV
ncbi:MAG: DoxX family protein [Candidatus Omnitrophota bacterium]